jgi:hypothetical protein
MNANGLGLDPIAAEFGSHRRKKMFSRKSAGKYIRLAVRRRRKKNCRQPKQDGRSDRCHISVTRQRLDR